MEQLKALRNRVIIQPILTTEKIKDPILGVESELEDEGYTTPGGIFIPVIVQEMEHRKNKRSTPKARVISVGPGVEEVKKGDIVLFNKHAVKEVGPDYPELVTINIHEIFGVVQ